MKPKGYGQTVDKFLVKTKQGFFVGFSEGGPVFDLIVLAKVFTVKQHAMNAANLVGGHVVSLDQVLADEKKHAHPVSPPLTYDKAAMAEMEVDLAGDLAIFEALDAAQPVKVVEGAQKLVVRWVVVLDAMMKGYKNFVFYGEPHPTGRLTSTKVITFAALGEAQTLIANKDLTGKATPQKVVIVQGTISMLRTPDGDYPVQPGGFVYQHHPSSELLFDYGQAPYTSITDATTFVVKSSKDAVYFINKHYDGSVNWSYGFLDKLKPQEFDYVTATKVAASVGGLVLPTAQLKIQEKFGIPSKGAGHLVVDKSNNPVVDISVVTTPVTATTKKFANLAGEVMTASEPIIHLATLKHHSWPAGGKGQKGNYVIYKDGLFLASGPKKKVPVWTPDPLGAYLYDYWQTAQSVMNKAGGSIARMVVNAAGKRLGFRVNAHSSYKPFHDYRWFVLRHKKALDLLASQPGMAVYTTEELATATKFMSFKAAMAHTSTGSGDWYVEEVVFASGKFTVKDGHSEDAKLKAKSGKTGIVGWFVGKNPTADISAWVVAKDGKFLLSASEPTWTLSPYVCGYCKDMALAMDLALQLGGAAMPLEVALQEYDLAVNGSDQQWFITLLNGTHCLTGVVGGDPKWGLDVNKAMKFSTEGAAKDFATLHLSAYPIAHFLFSQLILLEPAMKAPAVEPKLPPKKATKKSSIGPWVIRSGLANGTSYFVEYGASASLTKYATNPWGATWFETHNGAEAAAKPLQLAQIMTLSEASAEYHSACNLLLEPVVVQDPFNGSYLAGSESGSSQWTADLKQALFFHDANATHDYVHFNVTTLMPPGTIVVGVAALGQTIASAKKVESPLTKEAKKAKSTLELLRKAHAMLKFGTPLFDVSLVEKAVDSAMDLLEEKVF